MSGVTQPGAYHRPPDGHFFQVVQVWSNENDFATNSQHNLQWMLAFFASFECGQEKVDKQLKKLDDTKSQPEAQRAANLQKEF